MEEIKFFAITVHRKSGTYTKGVAVHDTRDAATQAVFNEFTAWAFGKDKDCDYVFGCIYDSNGALVRSPEVWTAATEE